MLQDYLRMDVHKSSKFKFLDIDSVLDQNDQADRIKSQIKHYTVQVNIEDLPEKMRCTDKKGIAKGVFLPQGISIQNLQNSSLCRNDGKFPTLQFVHKKSGNTIWRSSEINRAMMNKEELFDDIQFLKQLAGLTGRLFIYNHRDTSQ